MIDLPTFYTIGISEKPQAARRIAWALDEKNDPQFYRLNGVPIYQCERGGRIIIIVPAVGHLFTLDQIGKTWNYPILDYEWLPTYKKSSKSYTKKFVEVFKLLAEEANDAIVMTDYDREGEVIGYLILKYLLKKKVAERMKFSTLTKRDIIDAYKKKDPYLNKGLLNSGLIRHYVDWLFGINYTTALSTSLKKTTDKFKTISIGRVQGPTLGFVIDKEEEINLFMPTPYWRIHSSVLIDGETYEPIYEKKEIETKNAANEIVNDCFRLKGVVNEITEKKNVLYPFPPYNLSHLQRDAYFYLKYSPSKTLELAEKLYLKALISYPRTDSQKLPMKLGHKKILIKLKTQNEYSDFISEILKRKKFKPIEGKKTDAAHPAIHPTGKKPSATLSEEEKKIYDMIIKKYLSLFGPKAIQRVVNFEIMIDFHKFSIEGKKITTKGWIKYATPYVFYTDTPIPNLELKQIIKFDLIESKEEFSEPPRRYNESSLLQEMEANGLGTKATRASIIETLFKRGYIGGGIITPTELGIAVVDVLKIHYSIIVQTKMTKKLETLMEDIKNRETNVEEEILRIKQDLFKDLKSFHDKETEIGLSLYENIRELEEHDIIILGQCPRCKTGNLRVLKSKKSGKLFVGCSSYYESDIKCELTFPVPYGTNFKPTNEICPHDNLPLIEKRNNGNKKLVCISPDCDYCIDRSD